MTKYLVINTRYSDIEIGLFFNKKLIDYTRQDSKKISKNIILSFNELLDKNKLTLLDLSFIALNQGPAPFTSLRVVLASANAISFATNIPLVGINGLVTLVNQYKSSQRATMAILNAFSNDLYYAIASPNNSEVKTGCDSAKNVIELISKKYDNAILLGNGIKMYKQEIIANIKNINFVDPPVETATLIDIATVGYEKWTNKEISQEVMPIYLKKYSAKITSARQKH